MAEGKHGLPELIAERRAKAQRLRAAGAEGDFPYSFPGAQPIADVHAAYEHLAVGEETEDVHRVAGRLAGRRGQGRAAFLDLVDRSGKIQLHARLDVLGEEPFERLLSLDLGDLLGVDGAVLRSRHGELSLRVERFAVLAKALRPPPDKHHGLSDVETRHRQRELDLISSDDARTVFVERARIVSAVRAYLDGEGFVEVETPVLQPLYGGALARPFTTHHNALDRTLYLRIATELYLKRCIVGGLERVYELGKDFRNEGVSAKHNPEFTMVEWYEAYADYIDTATRLEELVGAAAQAVDYAGELDFARPWRRVGFVEAIAQATGIDVMAHRDGRRARGGDRAARAGSPDRGRHLAAARRRAALQVRRARTAPAHLRPRRARRALPLRPRAPLGARARRALRGVRRGHGDRQRLQRDQRPRRPARALRGPAAARRAGRRGDPALRRAVPGVPGIRDAPHGRRRCRHRPARDGAHRQRSIREVVLFPAMRT